MVTLEPINHFTGIQIDRSPAPVLDEQAQARVDAAWRDLCAQNPRYFNGDMLVFDRYDAATGVVTAHVDQYKRHAVRDSVDLGDSLLAVTAIVIADGCVLLGRRSTQTHRYGGLWELGPSGGVDVPAAGDSIDERALLEQAQREINEEAGFDTRGVRSRLIALVHDHQVGSSDLAMTLTLDQRPTIVTNWEYSQTRWVTIDELGAWASEKPDELIPTTVALARVLSRSRQ